VDLRLAKILKFGRTRTNVGFDIYNAMNWSPVLSYNQAFSPTNSLWLTPTGGCSRGSGSSACRSTLDAPARSTWP